MFTLVQARHDEVAALDQADAIGGIELEVILDEAGDPWTGSIDQCACTNGLLAAVGVLQFHLPHIIHPRCPQAAGTGVDVRAVLARAHGVEYHQARIVDRTVGVLEAAGNARLERVARAEAQAARGAQALAFAQVVIQEQTGADHPGRAQVRAVWQYETHRLDDMRGLGQQHFALGKGFAHQAKFVMLQVAQAAVDQLAAGRRGMLSQVVLFAQEHLETASGGVGSDAHAIDATADHDEVIAFGCGGLRRNGLGHGQGLLGCSHRI
ncbi:hypothetical protein D3C76_970300 [compost metagenome]